MQRPPASHEDATPTRSSAVKTGKLAIIAVVAVSAVAAVTAAAAGRGHDAGSAVAPGGTYRVEWESSFDFTSGFDPTGEYSVQAFGIYSNLLVRTLVGYNHLAGPAGNVLVPDLATGLGAISNGGRTYTFTLKRGIRFGPPLNRQITSRDVAYAFQRIGTKSLGAQYGFYYDVIRGMAAFASGKAKTISGIATPNERTVVFHLTAPTGDFRYRLAMPAAGPQPREVAGCFTKAGAYGRDLISSGPYMLAGSDKLDASSCAAVAKSGPISGFDGERHLDLVRNPAYDAKTDNPKARQNLPDEFTFAVNSNTDDIYARVARGDADDEIAQEPPTILREYQDSKQLYTNASDFTGYLTMNLTQPPFDDVHVRRAVNFAIDRQALRKARGGAYAGAIATHIAPNDMLGDRLKGYAPYGAYGRGDLAKAKAEMRLSRYDKNHDGICDAKACQNVSTLTADSPAEQGFVPSLEQSMKSIAITLQDRVLKDVNTPLGTPRLNVPFSTHPGWGKDYADPLTFFSPLFDGRTIYPEGNSNYSLVGITPATAKRVGATGDVKGVPSVDADLDRCGALVGAPRVTCYVALDKKLTTKIVPWVPYLWATTHNVVGKDITKWGFDQFGATTAYAHVAVK
jgi:peptide/nickel transport system substrate-binding protein